MRRAWTTLIASLHLAMLAGCTYDERPTAETVEATHATGRDADLRVMLSELASSKACAMIRGGFHGLRAPEHPDVVTGVLWIRECEITNTDAHVLFHITGNGWMWVDQTASSGGGTFAVRQYVRFGVESTIPGGLDFAYDPDAHVVSVWFTPDREPEVKFTTIGRVAVDSQGAWSAIVGAIGSAFATSPEGLAHNAATLQGTREVGTQLRKGLAVTINLCTGLTRVHLGHPPRGEMGSADVGETRGVPVEIQREGVMLIGPQRAGSGMTIKATAERGAVRLAFVCAKDAETVATEFMAGRIKTAVPVLGTVDVRKTAALEILDTSCPVVVLVTPLDGAPARFAWERPTGEIAASTGGPLINCPTEPK